VAHEGYVVRVPRNPPEFGELPRNSELYDSGRV